jgi:hypothetical protein
MPQFALKRGNEPSLIRRLMPDVAAQNGQWT